MKMKTLFFFTVLCFFMILACKAQKTKKLLKAEWLIGTWEIKTSKGEIYESWNKNSNMEFNGKSYRFGGRDTLVLETIRLIEESDGIFYIPIVKNQNKGLPIRFNAKTFTEDSLLFENQKHDFPQYISYAKITKDSLVAKISGTINGEIRSQTFKMRRVN